MLVCKHEELSSINAIIVLGIFAADAVTLAVFNLIDLAPEHRNTCLCRIPL